MSDNNLKCPKCKQKGFITKTKMADGTIKESFFCSFCFYDDSKQETKKIVQQITIKKEEDLKDVLENVAKQLNSCEKKTRLMKQFEEILFNFQKGEKIDENQNF